jgi:NAD(P)H dehydrogenase (quinone)
LKVLIVYAHAEPKSFNGAMLEIAVKTLKAAGHEVIVSDLYAMEFNPLSGRHNFTSVMDPDYFKQQLEEIYATENNGFAPDVQAEMDKLAWCDMVVLQFPLWWFGMPAILKGWVDRVFAMGKIYGGGRWYDQGEFKGKRAMCAITIGGPASMYQADGLNGDIHQILFPIHHGMLYFTGFSVLPPVLVHSPARMTDAEREATLHQYQGTLLTLEDIDPIPYPKLADYDETMVLKQPVSV